jgi:hypothetical protein
MILVPFATVFAPELNAPPLADVSLTNLTVAVTCDVCMLLNINPNTIVVVVGVLGAVYTIYGVPLEFGSAAKFTTLNVFAISFSLS